MTRSARLTQKRLEGEILKLLDRMPGYLYDGASCAFCRKYKNNGACKGCPVGRGKSFGCYHSSFLQIDNNMFPSNPDAIPGALAIYLWLEEL